MKHIKLLSIILVLCLTLCSSVLAADVNTTQTETTADFMADNEYSEAVSLISALIKDFEFDDASRQITRAQFVKYICELFKADYEPVKKDIFSDVKTGDYADNEIYNAAEKGWISSVENFYPENAITYVQSLKIAVCASGYEIMADNSGGYPQGYIETAYRYNLSDHIKSDMNSPMTVRDTAVLLYNLLNANEVSETVSAGRVEYYTTDRTYMESLYDIKKIRGVVTETCLTSIYSEEYETSRGYININGITYETDKNYEEYLGLICTAFMKNDGKTNALIAVAPDKYDESKFVIDDLYDVSDLEVQFYNESKIKKLKLNSPYYIIYNGKSVGSFSEVKDMLTDGNIKLIDNNTDGKYDYMIIDNYRYLFTNNVNVIDKTVGDKNDYKNSIIFNENKSSYYITDISGAEKSFYDIKIEDLLAVRESLDGKLMKIVICNESINGKITSIDLSSDRIDVDNTEYKPSSYLKSYYSILLNAGSYGRFIKGINGKLVTYSPVNTDYQYGYFIKAFREDINPDKVDVKLFSQDGSMGTYVLATKVSIDSNRAKTASEIYSIIAAKEDQLVRYKLNTLGEIVGMDFPETFDDNGLPDVDLPECDKLMKYNFNTNLLYRSSVKGCMPYFNLNGSIVMEVPQDISADEYFSVGSTELMQNDKNYEGIIDVYDITGSGTAGIAIVRFDSQNQEYTENDKSYIVDKVYYTLNSDDEAVYGIDCWADGTYCSLYLSYDVAVNKDSNTPLTPGDIFRAKFNSVNEISSIYVEVDASSGEAVKNSHSSVDFFGRNVAVTYQMGKIYSIDNVNSYLVKKKDIFGAYDYSFKSMENFNINTTKIVRYSFKEKQLQPISVNDIKTYKDYGDECDYMVIRQSRFAPQTIFVYE